MKKVLETLLSQQFRLKDLAGDKGIYLKQQLKDRLIGHKQCIDKHGRDMPEIRNWKWSEGGKAERATAGRKSRVDRNQTNGG
jgi:hypothetical protein